MKTNPPKTIDAYIASFPPDIQKHLKQVRATIKKVVPRAEETIKYGMPTFMLDKANLAHFAAFTKHIGFYPVPTGNPEFKEELANYKTGKGSIQFPFHKPMPVGLIIKIIKWNLKRIADKALTKS